MSSQPNSNPWSAPRRHTLVESENHSLSVGSPPVPGLIMGSPALSDPLQNLCNMFPQVKAATIDSVFQRSGRNPSVCAEMLLSLHQLSHAGDYSHFAGSSLESFDTHHGADPFRGLPLETIKMIAKYLTLFDLAIFGCLNRECKRLAEEELCTVTMLNNAGGMRQASDDRILNMLTRFPRLTAVSLQKCSQFQNFALLPFALQNAQIRSLNLAFCERLHDEDVRVVMNGLPALQQLDLSGTFIGDQGLENISAVGADRLRRLVLSGCQYITDFGITCVYTRCSSLEELDLRSTRIKPTAFEPVPSCARLTKLFMSSCKRMSNISFTTNEFSALSILVLSMNSNMTSVILDLPNLSILNLSSSKRLWKLVINSPILIVLNLSGCSLLADANFAASALAQANLYNCRSLPFSSIASLIRGCRTSLQNFDIRGCPQLIDDETADLVRLCPAIERFDVNGCKNLSPVGVGIIARLVQTANERRTAS